MRAKESVELLIYSLTIFHRQTCVFHVNIAEAEASNYWRNFLSKSSNKDEVCETQGASKRYNSKKYYRHIRLLNGLLFSMKSFCKRLIPNITNDKDGFISYTTELYKLYCFETLSGHKFILMVHPSIHYGNELLRQLYSTIYLENVIKSPEYNYGSLIDNQLFESSLGSFFKHFIQEIS
ncbi:Sybindin-like family protein [Cryptosporidium meleagridis]|uniref:Trafficking protein particle complex subunit n=1 Tax=Cryptosporidium meleagridis TaxID=93969 RepID=A0A2P4Z2J6_9CRYT|nr:Sybindin-like family protein [Cryptosporidium meleagridis]